MKKGILKTVYPALTCGEFLDLHQVLGQANLRYVSGFEFNEYRNIIKLLETWEFDNDNLWETVEAVRLRGLLDSSNT